MLHLTVRALEGTVLFRDHTEARGLFAIVSRTFPDAEAFCLMPDHPHILVDGEEPLHRLRVAMAAFARWRNAHRGESGPVWAQAAEPTRVADDQHLRRTVRYVHLNPCRAGLVTDPLEWPWSTHRDATGFAAVPVRERVHEPDRFHRWVSADPTVNVAGTELPDCAWNVPTWGAVRDAVAAICRMSAAELGRDRLSRRLAVRTAWILGLQDAPLLMGQLGIGRTTVYRLVAELPARGRVFEEPALYACVRAVGDPRFEALPPGDLRRHPAFARYRGRR